MALGAVLRFQNLNLKPVWLDEVITALFSLGRSYNDVPLEVVFPLDRLQQIFTLNSAVGCSQIAHNIAAQSTHPPLFFCLMHRWAAAPLVGVMAHSWVWTLRSLPALFGVGAIAAVYWLNAKAFSPTAGLTGAAMMAVSPFAVYLSQEARHYTLPLLLITLSLLGLIQIQQDILNRRLQAKVLLSWVMINSIGFYVHYFFILAFVAELFTLLGWMYCCRIGIFPATITRKSWVAVWLAIISVIASSIPWLPVMVGHSHRSETNWIPQPHNVAPLYQTLASWMLTVIALPTENQPLWIIVLSGLVMAAVGGWAIWHVFRGLKQLLSTPTTRLSTLTLLSFVFWVLLEFFTIVYLVGKDITIAPRYNFVYYPALCALIGASLSYKEGLTKKAPCNLSPSRLLNNWQTRKFYLLITSSFLSSVLVVSNLVFQKPFQPQQVAQKMNQQPDIPLMVVMGYENYQDVALGLSFGLALQKVRSGSSPEFAFFKSSDGYDRVWQKLSQLPPPVSQLNLWVVAPGLRRRDYPHHLALSSQSCTLDPTQFDRIGVPYQLYRC